MPTPAWIAATPGQPPLAAQVNQFLGSHASTYIYTGSSFSSQAVAGSGAVDSNSLYVAQSFTTGASTTTIGRVAITLSVTGVPAPMTVQIQSNSGGAPSGTVLVSTVIPPNWGNASVVSTSIPLPAAGLAPSTTYWVVTQPAGDVSDFFAFYKSNQASGVSTSANGTSWAAQGYGLLYAAYDQSAVPPLVHTWSDAAARITGVASNANGTVASIEDYTAGQGAGQYAYSYRALAYSSLSLTSVT